MARLMALVCDVFVGFIIALAPIFGLIFLSAGRVQGDSWSIALFVLVFVLYMTVAQFFFHTTVGKRLFGLQIRTAAKSRAYPDLLELMIRESAGRYLCQWWLGLGFLAATYDSMHMTWADRLAGTVVVRSLPVSRTMKIVRVVLIAGIVIALGLMVLGLMFVTQ
ncbi:MAG: RDD family protein [Acidobacteriia bacterium]|nr:RDD family protein [Terriglobia bacterium]